MNIAIISLVIHMLCAFIIIPSLYVKIQDREKEINILAHDLDIAEDKICVLRLQD